MKKLLFILPLVLCSCVNGFGIIPPLKTLSNEKCTKNQEYKIFQVLDEGALALSCTYNDYGDRSCLDMTVFIPKIKNELFYDDKIVKAKSDECTSYSGVYKYQSKDERNRTIPKIKFIKKRIPNPAYKEWLKNKKEK